MILVNTLCSSVVMVIIVQLVESLSLSLLLLVVYFILFYLFFSQVTSQHAPKIHNDFDFLPRWVENPAT